MTEQERLGIEDEDAGAFGLMPTLYGKTSGDKVKQWTIGWFIKPDGTVILRTRHGQVGGKLTNSDKRVKAVNVGKSNERDPKAQAEFETKAGFKKQLDVGMQTTIEAAKAHRPKLPMLVQTYKDNPEKITFPAYLQPKLNGVRCLGDVEVECESVQFISRKNKRYNGTVGHFIPYLVCPGIGAQWDGEIYRHGWSFAKILQRVKAVYPDSDQLQYWIYDVADETLTFEDRHKLVKLTLEQFGPIVIVPTVEVNNDEEVWKLHDEWVAQGFEGAIIRNKNGMYHKGLVRSYDVMRVKNFHDDEFEIVGGKAEEVQLNDGSWTNCLIFTCKTKDGENTFDPRPRGTVEERAQMYKDLPNLIGKQLTVRYAELSEDGIPIFPVGVAVRDYE